MSQKGIPGDSDVQASTYTRLSQDFLSAMSFSMCIMNVSIILESLCKSIFLRNDSFIESALYFGSVLV